MFFKITTYKARVFFLCSLFLPDATIVAFLNIKFFKY